MFESEKRAAGEARDGEVQRDSEVQRRRGTAAARYSGAGQAGLTV